MHGPEELSPKSNILLSFERSPPQRKSPNCVDNMSYLLNMNQLHCTIVRLCRKSSTETETTMMLDHCGLLMPMWTKRKESICGGKHNPLQSLQSTNITYIGWG